MENNAYDSHTQTHTEMGKKNIAISDEAYQRLRALKKAGESFTDVIERITRSRGVLELAGILPKAEGKGVRRRVEELRKESSSRVQKTIERVTGHAG